MANKGPHIKIGGVWKQGKRYVVKVAGAFRDAVSTFIKIGGVWRETKVALNSTITIGVAVSGSTAYGFDSGYYGAMGSPTLGWDTVIRSLYATRTNTDGKTRVTLNLGSGSLPQPFTQTRNIYILFFDPYGGSIGCVLNNSADYGPFNYWEVGNGAESAAVHAWLAARNGWGISVRGFLA